AVSGFSNPIVVSVKPATHFQVSAPGVATQGSVFQFVIAAQDDLNNAVPGYTGTVLFTSSDPQAVLPVNTTLTNGLGTLLVTLKSLGSQTITATDTATSSIAGTSNGIIVAPAVSSITRTTPAGPTTNAPSVTYTVTFSTAVTGVGPTDFQVILT